MWIPLPPRACLRLGQAGSISLKARTKRLFLTWQMRLLLRLRDALLVVWSKKKHLLRRTSGMAAHPAGNSAMDGPRNARRMRLSVQDRRYNRSYTMHPIRGSIELRSVQARIGSSPDAGEAERRRGGAGKRVRVRCILSVGCRSDGRRAPMGWTVNWDTVHPLGAVPGGKAARRRAKSRQARPRSGYCSGKEAEDVSEASAAAAPPAWAPSTAAGGVPCVCAE